MRTGKASAWPRWLSILALLLAVGAIAAALAGAVGSAQGAWDFRTGFLFLRGALFAAAGGLLLAIVAWLLARRKRQRLGIGNLVALLLSVGFLLYLGNWIMAARSVPAIHDVATNLDDLPQFSRLSVRADNLDAIPDNDDPALAALPPEERWKALHRQAYGDLRTVRLPVEPAVAIRRAEELARERGWQIARADPAAGVLEATETSRFFGFKDDVVVRARSAPGGGSLVDMRSVSRVGQSDVGMNARRVRAFLADLSR